jgi:hypothetical protein
MQNDITYSMEPKKTYPDDVEILARRQGSYPTG